MKHCIFFLLLGFLFNTSLLASELSSSLLKAIKATEHKYSERKKFDEVKVQRINELKNQLQAQGSTLNDSQRYEQNKQLFIELYSFKSQEAFNIALQMEQLANRMKSSDKRVEALLFKTDVLLCAGLFNEAIDVIAQVGELSSEQSRVHYFSLMTRLYGDLLAYNDVSAYHPEYRLLNHAYADSLLQVANENHVDYQLVRALKLIDLDMAEDALDHCRLFVEQPSASEHEKAKIYSCMAWACYHLGDLEGQVRYLLNSIESDIRSSTYETTSGRLMAQVLLENGEIRLAHQFLIRAIQDAEFYGARQRKAEITHIVPIIELQLKEIQQIRLAALASILMVVCVSLVVIIYLWMRLVRRHNEVKRGRDIINEQNSLLATRNEQLTESNKIKEESLTNYFELSSVYFHEMEKMQAKIRSLLLQKKYDVIADYLTKSGPGDDKEQLFERFDALFNSLFPTFVERINVVLEPSMQIEVTTPVTLSAELRVFALSRLGIDSAERVASILGISRNTVYTYRNRVKSRAKMEPDEFEQYVMSIPSF
ncbi:hypothetical protein KEM09_04965 [Carboxylicivirga mesophila]|uniref:DUF6377 domain-containing protein n=1 Tax=Carboxylicivirga mesophila TaxID=1166478 RepID=A0ABS5K763_9BACT|nr:DUF6377 domain-containing protein [Carboxylicivirga mesophila]MBS2210737.1 hypothetical protein [Carboxylicivirga mesophila]